MPGFGKRHRVIHALTGADFADHDYVRRLAKGVFQRCLPTVGIDTDFTLGNDAALVLVYKLDRVLDGDDVARRVLVAVADQRRQRSGLAGAGGADKQDDAALGHRQCLQHRRQVEFVDGGNARLDPAQHHANLIALIEAADTKAADAGNADGKVAFVGFLELLALCRRHHVQHQIAALLRRQCALRDRRNFAIDLH
jgi:hypothetical protein